MNGVKWRWVSAAPTHQPALLLLLLLLWFQVILALIHISCVGRWKCCGWIIEAADDLRANTLLLLHEVFFFPSMSVAADVHIFNEDKRGSLSLQRRDSSKEPNHANDDQSYHVIWGLVIKIKCSAKTDALKWYTAGLMCHKVLQEYFKQRVHRVAFILYTGSCVCCSFFTSTYC